MDGCFVALDYRIRKDYSHLIGVIYIFINSKTIFEMNIYN